MMSGIILPREDYVSKSDVLVHHFFSLLINDND